MIILLTSWVGWVGIATLISQPMNDEGRRIEGMNAWDHKIAKYNVHSHDMHISFAAIYVCAHVILGVYHKILLGVV